jgi:hypothetical protein
MLMLPLAKLQNEIPSAGFHEMKQNRTVAETSQLSLDLSAVVNKMCAPTKHYLVSILALST